MAELELVGLHAGGEHLVLIGPDGQRHRLVIDEALRAAVRGDRPRLEQVRTNSELRPREIQSRLRAGASPAEIAREAGVTVEHVRRYESPVLAERNWVAQQARNLTVGRDSDAPRLGDLALDRLAGRGVPPDELRWTAVRRPGEGWELQLRFDAGGRERLARWSVDVPTSALRALDDESRWLSETDLAAPPDNPRHLSAVHTRTEDVEVYDVESDTRPKQRQRPDPSRPAGSARTEADQRTAEILDGLRANRGVRQELPRLPEEDEIEAYDEPSEARAAEPAGSSGPSAPEASVLPLRAVPASRPTGPDPAYDAPAGATEPAAEAGPAAGTTAARATTTPQAPTEVRRAPKPVEKQAPRAPGKQAERPGPATPPRQQAPANPPKDQSPTRTDGEAADPTQDPLIPQAGPREAARRTKSRSRRTSVPSWDEIVFGAKQD